MQPDAFADAVVVMVKNALSPVLERMASVEARIAVLGDVRDRVVGLEATAAAVAPLTPPAPVDVSPLLERIAVIDATLARPDPHSAAIAGAEAAMSKIVTELSSVRERLAVVETRAPVPGPPGPAGTNGLDGRNGTDGINLDDLSVVQEDERTLIVRGTVGARIKDVGSLTFPVDIYRGVWIDGKAYDRGDGVTWGGSEWHCNDTTTTKPGDGSKAWTLKVKRGRDGKDGKGA